VADDAVADKLAWRRDWLEILCSTNPMAIAFFRHNRFPISAHASQGSGDPFTYRCWLDFQTDCQESYA